METLNYDGECEKIRYECLDHIEIFQGQKQSCLLKIDNVKTQCYPVSRTSECHQKFGLPDPCSTVSKYMTHHQQYLSVLHDNKSLFSGVCTRE